MDFDIQYDKQNRLYNISIAVDKKNVFALTLSEDETDSFVEELEAIRYRVFQNRNHFNSEHNTTQQNTYEDPTLKIKYILSRDGEMVGTVINAHSRRCTMEGCLNHRASVRWPDGHLTYPCWGGMHIVSKDTAQIL